jgi:hypothetical protein
MICGLIDCIQKRRSHLCRQAAKIKALKNGTEVFVRPPRHFASVAQVLRNGSQFAGGISSNVRGPLRLRLTRGVPLILTVDKIKPLLPGSFSETTRSWRSATARALFMVLLSSPPSRLIPQPRR